MPEKPKRERRYFTFGRRSHAVADREMLRADLSESMQQGTKPYGKSPILVSYRNTAWELLRELERKGVVPADEYSVYSCSMPQWRQNVVSKGLGYYHYKRVYWDFVPATKRRRGAKAKA